MSCISTSGSIITTTDCPSSTEETKTSPISTTSIHKISEITTTKSLKDNDSASLKTKITILYSFVVFLCVFIVLWIVVFPSTWMVGRFGTTFHHAFVQKQIIRSTQLGGSVVPVPNNYGLKFQFHTAVQLLHHLPGVMWGSLIPIQLYYGYQMVFQKNQRQTQQQKLVSSLHEGVKTNGLIYQSLNSSRNTTSSRFHKLLGWIFMAASGVLVIGAFLILKRKLTVQSFHDDNNYDIRYEYINLIISDTFSVLTSIWFLYTAFQGYVHARYRKNFALHSYWMIRHIGSGIWISLMRFAVVPMFIPFGPFSPSGQRIGFSLAGFLSLFISVLLSEYSISLLKKLKTQELLQKNNDKCIKSE